MAHIADRASSEVGVLYTGGVISFSESLEKFVKNLSDVKPDIFLGVPRIYAKIQEGVLSKLSQKKLDRLLSIPIVNSLIRKFIKRKIGLINASIVACGAAPLPVFLSQWYERLGITIQDIYGMTENCAYSHGARGDHPKNGSVGKAWPEVQAKLGEDNEILVKHDGMMTGYFKDPEATKNVFTSDGFLKTGDQGFIDGEGYLTITGRLKDQFKTDKGKFIAPSAIEMKLLMDPHIEQVCVVGSGVPQPIGLITLSLLGKSKSKEEIIQHLSEALTELNPSLETFERLEKLVIMKNEWSIENGLMTPTLKVKRNEIEKMHLLSYPKWYVETGTIIWEN